MIYAKGKAHRENRFIQYLKIGFLVINALF
jgi:hypothetical protein